MIVSLWRLAHFALALVSSLFLVILSLTGVVLAVAAIDERSQGYRIDDLGAITLSDVLPTLWETYPEMTILSVDHNGYVAIEAMDADGQPIHAYIDPVSGKILGQVQPQSEFVQWNIALHRSLFLKETGRIIVGAVSFFLLLITLTGIALIVKRQQGLRNFFAKVNRDFFSQYFHVVSGRIFLIPVLLLALTGTYLFMVRIGLVEGEQQHSVYEESAEEKPLADFSLFQKLSLQDVEKVEFPFLPDDPEEFFVLKLRDRELTVHQLTGAVVEESRYPYALVLEKLSLDLHTGKTNSWWALVLGFASLNILFFIYTGFAITLRRKQTKVKNELPSTEAEYVLLVGTENGTTLSFASKIQQQLLSQGCKAYLTDMNRLAAFPSAKHLMVFTSTYGLGTAPANATQFERMLAETALPGGMRFSVVGFGSHAYPDFCAYAHHVDQLLEKTSGLTRCLPLYTVNDRTPEEFVAWTKAWSAATGIELGTTPALYASRITGLKAFDVVERTELTQETFKLVLRPSEGLVFQSGDLLAIYPAGRERLYSIGEVDGMVQLLIKRHPGGLGSEFLYGQTEGDRFLARIVRNASFHFPDQSPGVIMIANGTGIAPFLGMISQNKKCLPITLYAGFRYNNALTQEYRSFANRQQEARRLSELHLAFSREEGKQYVMDLIRRDETFVCKHLVGQGIIMICGSLAMQKDVEAALAEICAAKGLPYPKDQIQTDCY